MVGTPAPRTPVKRAAPGPKDHLHTAAHTPGVLPVHNEPPLGRAAPASPLSSPSYRRVLRRDDRPVRQRARLRRWRGGRRGRRHDNGRPRQRLRQGHPSRPAPTRKQVGEEAAAARAGVRLDRGKRGRGGTSGRGDQGRRPPGGAEGGQHHRGRGELRGACFFGFAAPWKT